MNKIPDYFYEYLMNNIRNAFLEDLVKEVIISPEVFNLTKEIAEDIKFASIGGTSLPEDGGLIVGSSINNKLYVLSLLSLKGNYEGSLNIDVLSNKHSNEIEKLSHKKNDLKFVIYHSHPEITEETIKKFYPENAKEIINFIQDEINNGVHDHFSNDGNKPNLNLILNETFSRFLSEADLANNIGKYHLLITPTLNNQDEFNHLNFYKIINKKEGLVGNVPIRGMVNSEKQIFRRLIEQYDKTLDS